MIFSIVTDLLSDWFLISFFFQGKIQLNRQNLQIQQHPSSSHPFHFGSLFSDPELFHLHFRLKKKEKLIEKGKVKELHLSQILNFENSFFFILN